jgi:hypothetical protein
MARESVNDRFAPLLAAMEAAGGELPAPDVRELLEVPDKRNLGRAVLPAIAAGLLHRRREGPNAVYVVGADPATASTTWASSSRCCTATACWCCSIAR